MQRDNKQTAPRNLQSRSNSTEKRNSSISDVSDGLSKFPSKPVQAYETNGVEKLDSIIVEYGPLFTSDEKTTHANQVALAAKFSQNHST